MWKYYLCYIKNLFYLNWVKILFLLASFVVFYLAGSFSDEVTNYKLLSEQRVNRGSETIYLYLVEDVARNGRASVDYKLIDSEVEFKIIDGYLEVYSYNEFNVLLWLLFGCIIIFVFVFSLNGWDLYLVRKKTLLEFIKCELEGGKFYYTAFGRLLGVKESQLRFDHLSSSLSIHTLSEVRLCPKFKTKKQSRVYKLKSLGI